MAHATLHFSFGIVIGSCFALPALIKAWLGKLRGSDFFGRWLLLSYAAGIFAVVPGILRRLGGPDPICDGKWMNGFLLYPWINAIKPGAQTMGPLVLGALLGTQYLAILAALAWTLRRNRRLDTTRH